MCNNLLHPLWGSSSTRLSRFLSPRYSDGRSTPRGAFTPSVCDRTPNEGKGSERERRGCPLRCYTDPRAQLPSPRLVSRTVHPPVSRPDKRSVDFCGLLWFVVVVVVVVVAAAAAVVVVVVVFHEYCGYIEEILDAFSSQAPMFGIKSKFP